MNKTDFTIILFYKFIPIQDPEGLMTEQKQLCQSLGLTGRMLIATEGVNATLEGKTSDIKTFQKKFRTNPLFKDVVFKESQGTGEAFSKLQVKVRDEVVTLGAGRFDILKDTAPKISATQLQKMYEEGEDFVVLDLRNDFEIQAGRFQKTVNPNLRNFRDLPTRVSELTHLKDKKVIAVCTGGIRCEKATPLLKREGFTDLYQLEDGIHAYMQQYPTEFFEGSLFVFDNRMTTPIVENLERKIVGRCAYCESESEDFYNDDSVRPSKKVICCTSCIPQYQNTLRPCIMA